MRTKEFIEFAESTCSETIAVLQRAQAEYANPENAFEEFEETAKLLGITPRQVWGVHFLKHVRGVCAYIRGQRSQREGISGRRRDAVNYLLIAEGMDSEPTESVPMGGPNQAVVGEPVSVNVAATWTLNKLAQVIGVPVEQVRLAYRDNYLRSDPFTESPSNYIPGTDSVLYKSEIRAVCRYEDWADRVRVV